MSSEAAASAADAAAPAAAAETVDDPKERAGVSVAVAVPCCAGAAFDQDSDGFALGRVDGGLQRH